MKRATSLITVVLSVLALATLLTGCDTAARSCDHRGFVRNTQLANMPGPLPDFTSAEVTESAKWTTTGIGGPCRGQSTTDLREDNMDAYSNRCYANPFDAQATNIWCKWYTVEWNPPYGAMQINNEGYFSYEIWANTSGKWYYNHLINQIRVVHRSGDNDPDFIGKCFITGGPQPPGESYDCEATRQY